MVSLYSKLKDFLRKRPKFIPVFFTGPAAIITAIFLSAIFFMILVSFYKYTPGYTWKPTLTLENHIEFLMDPFYHNYILSTLRLSGMSTIISFIMGFPVAYLLARSKSHRIKGVILMILVIPNFTNIVARMLSLGLVLYDTGLVNQTLIYLGIVEKPLKLMYNELAVIIGLTYWILPLIVFTLIGTIQRVDPSLEEAAQSLGANKLQTFGKITLPLCIPGISLATLLAYVSCITAYVIPRMMGGGTVRFIADLIYYKAVILGNFPFGSAASIYLGLIVLTIVLVIYKFLMRKVKVE